MSDIDVNKIQQNVKELQDQNAIDFQQWKKLGKDIEKLSEKIKLSDTNLSMLMKKIKNDYEKLKKIIIDENVQVQLNNKIEKNKSEIIDNKNKFEDKVDKINSDLIAIDSKKLDNTAILSMGNLGQDVKEAMTGGSVAVVGKNSVGNEQYKFNSISTNKTNFIKQGKNLLDIKSMVNGYLNSSGEIVSSNNHKTTDFIRITGNKLSHGRGAITTERLNQPMDIRFVCFYNSNYESITESFYDNASLKLEVVPIPSNAVYMRVTLFASYTQDKFSMLYFGDKTTQELFEPYKEEMTDLVLSDKSYKQACYGAIKEINNTKLISEESLTFTQKIGNNMWNKNNLINNGFFDANDTFISDNNYDTSNYINVKNHNKISLYTSNNETPTLGYIRIMCCYDEQLKLIRLKRYENASYTNEIVNIPDGVSYIRVTIRKEFSEKAMLVFDDVVPTKYEPYKIRLDNVEINNLENNKLKGKILLNFGDSIAAGDGNNGKGYAEILGELYEMEVHDYAIGGTTLGGNIPNQIDNVVNKNLSPDFILIEGGTNDVTDGSTIKVGTINSSFDISQFDKTTTTGGLEYCLYKLKNAFPNAKIAFVSVHKMGSRNYEKQVERQKACIEVCKKWCIPIVDVGNRGNLNTFLPSMHKFTNPTTTQPKGDRTHPNDLGYRTFYIPLLYEVLTNI